MQADRYDGRRREKRGSVTTGGCADTNNPYQNQRPPWAERTHDHKVKSLALYPTELDGQLNACHEQQTIYKLQLSL